MEWQTGDPPESGYYLAAWPGGVTLDPYGRHLVVSELWFNPDAYPKWWSTRGYVRDTRDRNPTAGAMKADIVAWMPMPDPPPDAT
jgi:hypothetical protein